MRESWKSLKEVVQCGDNYEVSSLGKVKNAKTGRILKAHVGQYGYESVSLSLQGKSKTYIVHRLVALAFIPNPENKPEVNHKDGKKTNNRKSNLEWATSAENQRHAVDTGLQVVKYGEETANANLSNSEVRRIKRMLIRGVPYTVIANKFGVSKKTVSLIHLGKQWASVQVKGFTPKAVVTKTSYVVKPEGVPFVNSNAAKLTEQEVREIRSLHSTGKYSHSQLATLFDTGKRNITQIVNYKTWRHVE